MPAKRRTRTRQSRSPRRKAAATADILDKPGPVSESAVPAKWRKYYDRLMQLRNYLTSRQDGLVRDAQEEKTVYSLHMADAATDSFDRDLALSRASSEQEALYEIDEALDRIREKTYGACELTGKPIDPARLEAIPWTRFSLEAEEILEHEGKVQTARLAPRAPVPRGGEPESSESETI